MHELTSLNYGPEITFIQKARESIEFTSFASLLLYDACRPTSENIYFVDLSNFMIDYCENVNLVSVTVVLRSRGMIYMAFFPLLVT